jgi:broad specificity phosphatase PhoE
MKIIFARHGESQANTLHIISNRKLPHGLTSKGREQAAILVNRLQENQINLIYTSPIPRAVETGDIIAASFGAEIKVVDALREYDCGIIEGHSDEAAWQDWQELFGAWTIYHHFAQQIEGGESYHEVKQRFLTFIEGVIKEYAESPAVILCISHAGIYSIMLPLVLQNVDHDMISKYGIGYTSLIVAEQVKSGLVCTQWNEHLLLVE